MVAIWEMRHALLGHKIPTLADSTTITQSQIPGHYTGPVRTIGAAALVSLANVVSLNLSLYPKSSYVCPTALSVRHWAVLAQVASLVLDLCILQSVKSMVWSFKSSKSMSARTAPVIIGFITMVCCSVKSLRRILITYSAEFGSGCTYCWVVYENDTTNSGVLERCRSRFPTVSGMDGFVVIRIGYRFNSTGKSPCSPTAGLSNAWISCRTTGCLS